MKTYKSMTREELLALRAELEKAYVDAKGKALSLNMARGKPSKEQLDLTKDMLDVLNSNSDLDTESGLDTRNYGELAGIDEARKLMGDIIGVPKDNVLVCGNSSLQIMYDTVARSFAFGVNGEVPWCKLDKVKFLCPVPGYDRHFAITEQFGVEMIPIPLYENGPDMKLIKEYVENDEAVKGIWCTPKYSNPTGYTYSDETVRAFASLRSAAKDFRIYWDNAYCVHDLYEDKNDSLLNIFEEASKCGNEDIVYEFVSSSKISFAGSGVSAVATSEKNIGWFKQTMKVQTIGSDKINQLRHARYFKNVDGIKAKMCQHASILRPKFEAVLNCFDKELSGLDIGSWTMPIGGYFISFWSMDGCAKEIVAKCKEAGMTLTGAGATYPYGKDPMDSNIRIAPSYPTLSEIESAAELFVLVVKLVSVNKILDNM